MINVSAPGKLILFGEHAVVYDKIGIAVSLDKRCFVKAFSINENNVFIDAKDLNSSGSISEKELFDFYQRVNNLKDKDKFDEIREVFKKDELVPSFFVIASILKKYGFKGLKIEIKSEIPKNLGSSSAVFVAIALAVTKFLGKNVSKKEISNFAYQGDIIAHGGTPSGIDNSTVTYGDYIQYKKSEGIKPIDIKFSFPLIIVDSGELARTGETVAAVRRLREKNREFVDSVLDKLEEISYSGIEALKSKNLEKIGNLTTSYYFELKKLKISTPRLDQIVKIALQDKALGAKPTGGWGGGCCIALAKTKKQAADLIKIFKKNGFNSFQCEVGAEGVKLIL